ncbi:MAG: hypothetical protein A2648_00815 [Candidatus Lloydbacteria bacterium RIFCSPHIGHO2_01_FULL_41_20]|uniref:Uncharacterized protein n=1 Tax=Candidatus Lloydbacteria bacterium RIFCSPHIGHO2_01_FULL_41_20 TaxID=1798657 RepID=A0A1G2CTB9_9BACT|nr:MAG: hypothetical protein A2648_00815 [Candidatus Lloydbacteria bacterium RIFCSPHIGHO2_01_FULL_41_20]
MKWSEVGKLDILFGSTFVIMIWGPAVLERIANSQTVTLWAGSGFVIVWISLALALCLLWDLSFDNPQE